MAVDYKAQLVELLREHTYRAADREFDIAKEVEADIISLFDAIQGEKMSGVIDPDRGEWVIVVENPDDASLQVRDQCLTSVDAVKVAERWAVHEAEYEKGDRRAVWVLRLGLHMDLQREALPDSLDWPEIYDATGSIISGKYALVRAEDKWVPCFESKPLALVSLSEEMAKHICSEHLERCRGIVRQQKEARANRFEIEARLDAARRAPEPEPESDPLPWPEADDSMNALIYGPYTLKRHVLVNLGTTQKEIRWVPWFKNTPLAYVSFPLHEAKDICQQHHDKNRMVWPEAFTDTKLITCGDYVLKRMQLSDGTFSEGWFAWYDDKPLADVSFSFREAKAVCQQHHDKYQE